MAKGRGAEFGGRLLWLLGSVAEVLLPPLCPLCREGAPQDGQPFCSSCRQRLLPLAEPFCSTCGLPYSGAGPCHPCPRCLADPPPFQALRSWGVYQGALLDAVHAFKYRRQHQLRGALEQMAAEGFARFCGEPGFFSAVVPVPPDRASLRKRGFDLPALLARSLSRRHGIPWRLRALAKVRRTPDLVGLRSRERAQAVRGAYRGVLPLEGAVLLVDDVATSTATARECAKACREAGARQVVVLVLARTPMQVR